MIREDGAGEAPFPALKVRVSDGLVPRVLLVPRLLGLLLVLFCWASAQDLTTDDPYRVKAAFLRNFARYVSWPAQALPERGDSWQVGILGRDPFGQVLDASLDGRVEHGHAFRILRADSLDRLAGCQIIFVAHPEPEKRRATLQRLRGRPVLTVGDAPSFLAEGGMIRFRVGERVEMGINLDQARAASLGIPSKMLEVASEILENGQTRKKR